MKRILKTVVMAFMAAMMLNIPMEASAEGVKDIFDAQYYADANQDLKALFGYNEKALLDHYMKYGLKEGRIGSTTFNVAAYRAAYADLNAAFGDNWDAYVNHYYKYGMAEGRIAGAIVPANDQPTTPAAPASPAALSYEEQVVALVNYERVKAGLSVLAAPADIAVAAAVRAREQELLFSHTRPDGRSCFTVFDDLGISYWSVGENVAYGHRSPAEVFEGWMNSPGHRANIMSPDYTNIGVGYWKDANGVNYWSQLFSA